MTGPQNYLLLVFVAISALLQLQVAAQAEREVWKYTEVRPGARMFWWLMYSRAPGNPSTIPLVIWLTGGPGAASTGWGNFEEVGPINWELNPRNTTWLDHVHLLFPDSPVGSGYSHVQSPDLLTTTNREIALDLITMLKAVLVEAPELASSPIYIVGESYGGKMGPEFAWELHKASVAGEINANVQGVVIRDGWPSPVDGVTSWPQYMLQTGLVDTKGYNLVYDSAQQCKQAIESERWIDASDLFDVTMSLINDVTYGVDVFYILSQTSPPASRTPRRGLNKAQATCVGDILDEDTLTQLMSGVIFDKLVQGEPTLEQFGTQKLLVKEALWEDFMKPSIDIVEALLTQTNVKVMVVNGQLDLIVDTQGALQWCERMNWPGSSTWNAATRDPIVVNGLTQGYVKRSGQFSFWWVNRAGHSAFFFNPQAGLRILQDLTGTL